MINGESKEGAVVESSLFEPWEGANTDCSNQMFFSDLYNLAIPLFFFKKRVVGIGFLISLVTPD